MPYSKKVFEGDELIDENEIISSLVRIGKELKIDVEDFIVTSIFSDKVLFRQIKMPKIEKKSQIIDATKFQIVKELSISSSSITVDVDIANEGNNLNVSSFVVRNEDIERLKSFFSKSGIPVPDIIDAGYFKFNYLIEDKFGPGIYFLVLEDSVSTYLEFFKDGKFISIDSVSGGSDELRENNPVDAKVHYLQLSDDIQRLSRMLLSRYSMQNEFINTTICASENMKYVDEWISALSEADIGQVKNYFEFVDIDKNMALGAYNLAMRGAAQIAKVKFLHKKT